MIFILLFSAYGGLVWKYQYGQTSQGSNNSNPVAQSIIPPIHQSIERIAHDYYEGEEQKQEKRDFEIADHKAQIRMSRYAFFGVILGIFGSGLLVKTLLYTRDASIAASETLSVARKATKAEFQPYLSAEHIKRIGVVLRSRGDVYHQLNVYTNDFQIKNVGKTPASEVEITARAVHYDQGRHFDINANVSDFKTGDMTPTELWYCSLSFEIDFPDGDANDFERIREMDIYITVKFRDMFSDKKFRTYVFHYLCDTPEIGAKLQSIEEKKT